MGHVSRIVMLAAALTVLSAVSSADRLHGQFGSPSPQRLLAQQFADPSGNMSSGGALPLTIVISGRDVEGVVGKEVRSSTGENMGRIVEVVVDRFGQVR